jgi:thiol:disulfide interchange protein DsbD
MRRAVVWALPLAILLVPGIAAAGPNKFECVRQQGWLWAYLVAFGIGFQTSLTPCVYPMIPITLGIFGARGNVKRSRALALAAAYVGGMGLMYATLGVIFSLIGKETEFGTQLASPFVVIPLVIFFGALAASMFGAFELNLPASLQAKLNSVGGQGFKGAFAMGIVGGLIAAPCTGPFLLGLLAYVATSHDVVRGGSMLFVYALGMGVLFFVLAMFAVSLPKSGRWMEWVKSAAGIFMLLAALYYLAPLVPAMRKLQHPQLGFLLGALGIAALGFLLGAIHLSFHGAWSERLRKGWGVACVVVGLFGAWSWYMAPKQELPWLHDESAAFAKAKAEHKGVMIDFGATWCNPCRELEHTFADPDVYVAITDNFVPLKFDVSDDNATNDARKAKYEAGNLPAVRYLTADGKSVGKIDHVVEPAAMMKILDPAIAGVKANSAVVGTGTEVCAAN